MIIKTNYLHGMTFQSFRRATIKDFVVKHSGVIICTILLVVLIGMFVLRFDGII